jgi:hypothetical protein
MFNFFKRKIKMIEAVALQAETPLTLEEQKHKQTALEVEAGTAWSKASNLRRQLEQAAERGEPEAKFLDEVRRWENAAEEHYKAVRDMFADPVEVRLMEVIAEYRKSREQVDEYLKQFTVE